MVKITSADFVPELVFQPVKITSADFVPELVITCGFCGPRLYKSL